MTKIAWGNSVPEEFRARVLSICAGFKWGPEHPSWLMACMHFESGGTFSPSIKNMAGSGATGIIQFMPKTAIGLGTTVDELAMMTAVRQLDYVERYFKPYAKRIKSLADMYMAILLPSAIGKPEDAPLFSGGVAYRQNAALDSNSDGIVTKEEATMRVAVSLANGLKEPNVFLTNDKPKGEPMPALSASILINALPALIGKLPEIANIFKNPDVSERNVEAVAKVGEILMSSTKATNMQEAVEMVQADPQTANEANQALRVNRAELMDLVERMAAIEDKRVDSAREFNQGEPLILSTKILKLKFVHIVSLIFILLGGAAAGYVLLTSADPSERVMALQTLLIVGFAGVAQFWIGSSRSSQLKDEVKGAQ